MLRRWGATLLTGLLLGTGLTGLTGASASAAVVSIPENCTAVTDQGLAAGPHRGSLAADQTDCLQLSTPAGATVGVFAPAATTRYDAVSWTLINGDG